MRLTTSFYGIIVQTTNNSASVDLQALIFADGANFTW